MNRTVPNTLHAHEPPHSPNPGEPSLEPLDGIEPSTYSLRVNCSTPELQRLLDSKSGWTIKERAARERPLSQSVF